MEPSKGTFVVHIALIGPICQAFSKAVKKFLALLNIKGNSTALVRVSIVDCESASWPVPFALFLNVRSAY